MVAGELTVCLASSNVMAEASVHVVSVALVEGSQDGGWVAVISGDRSRQASKQAATVAEKATGRQSYTS